MSNEFFSEEYVEELISRVKEGDNDAWNEFYYNYLTIHDGNYLKA